MSEAALCSRLSAERGLPLIGSAGCHQTILAFELDPPWTPRLTGSRGGGAALDAALDAIGRLPGGVRVLALEPAAPSPDGRVRVILFDRGDGDFARYSRSEYRVLRDTLPAVLRQLAETGSTPADPVVAGDLGRDLMVCTHGSRDACCGKFGYPLYRRLSELAARQGDGLRVWRCSHLGGHRFAPTLLDLPSGRMFGRVAEEDAEALLAGGAELADRAGRIYRGRTALPEPAQIVERQLWERNGADLDGAALRWSVDGEGDRFQVRLEATCPDGRTVEMRAVVERSAGLAVATPASCGRDPETETPWSIVS